MVPSGGLSHQDEHGPRSPRRYHLLWLLAASLLAPALLFGAYAKLSYDHTFAAAEAHLQRSAAVLSEHVGRVFDSMGVALDLAEERLAGMSETEIRLSGRVSSLLSTALQRAGLDALVNVVDAKGISIANSGKRSNAGKDVSDREYFLAPTPDGALHVGPLIHGRVAGDRLFTLSRRRAGGGVINGVLYTRYFEQLFASAADRDGGVVSLYRADGHQLVRYPVLERPVTLGRGSGLMTNISKRESGTYRITSSAADGRGRLFAFQKVAGYPVYLTSGVDVAVVRSEWLRSLIPGALAALLAVATLLAFTLLAMRREREGAIIAARLEAAVAERTAEAEQRAAEAEAATREREEALHEADQANAAKSHFLASASHDLRQPVQALRLFLDVLSARLERPENRLVLEHAGRALTGAEELLSALLDVSTLEAGTVRIDPRPFALDDILAGLAGEFAPQAQAQGLVFRYVPCSAHVESDPVLLARMLRNLLANALRYTPAGSILLGCRLAGDNVRIEVWDTGSGIPDDMIEKVFDDFFQVGNVERSRSKGLGLGLAVVRRMAALLGHRLGVRSRLGRGTVFAIEVPTAEPASAGAELKALSA